MPKANTPTKRGRRHDARALNVSERDYILLKAGARLVGYDSFADYVQGLIDCEIENLKGIAYNKTGRFEIPLTRHEKAALDACRQVQRTA